MKKLTVKKILSLLVLGLLISVPSYAEVAVIVHKDSPLTSVDVKDIERVYLGKSKSIGDVSVEPINQENADEFNRVVLNKSSSQVKAYWSKLLFTGKGNPPKTVNDNASVIAEVSGNPNIIGYIDSSAVTDAVKVIATLK